MSLHPFNLFAAGISYRSVKRHGAQIAHVGAVPDALGVIVDGANTYDRMTP